MINFEKHLKELLYLEDFIIVPGLGAFIASFSQAKILESGELIEPIKTFEFNGLLNVDEGNKFTNYILRKENLPKAEIELQLKDYLFKFKSSLNTNKKVIFADVCSIERSSEGILLGDFVAEENFYGKPDFKSSELINPIAVKTLNDVYGKEEVPIQREEAKREEEVVNIFEEEIEDESRPWVKYLLYLLPLILVFGALYYLVLNKPFNRNETPAAEIQEITASDSADLTNAEMHLEPIDTSAAIEDMDSKAVVEEIHQGLKDQTIKKSGKYEVSAGLFKKKENADKLAERMTKAGFNAEIKLVSGMRRVYVSVNGIEEAEAMSARIEQFTGDKSVYFDENGISNK